jgi:hypothetical protein
MSDPRMDTLIRVSEVATRRVQTRVAVRRVLVLSPACPLHLALRLHIPVDPDRFQPYATTAMGTILR